MRLDLHRHLEGSHSPRALLAVARAHEVRRSAFFDARANVWRDETDVSKTLVLGGPSDDATSFYRCIVKARAAYVSVAAIGELARLAFDEAALETDGLEMRISLFSMTRTLLENQGRVWRDLAPLGFADEYARPILLAVLQARDESQRATGKPMLVRLGLSRTFESEPHYAALADMITDHASDLVGLDVLGIISGPDKEPLPPPLLAVLARMRRSLPDLTIHAGEFEGYASVDRCLALEPRGIGHGIRSLESEATLAALVRQGVTLEVCPTSNRMLIPSELTKLERTHGTPLRALQAKNVHCVLGSDDPTPLATSFSEEHRLAARLGVDMARLKEDSVRRWTEITGSAPRASS